jgi:molybdopterin-containing oxidoreductase family iron-sulfur binding subunit
MRWAMSIDLDLCSGCGACTVACAQENNLPLGNPEHSPGRLIRWMEMVAREEGEYPHTDLRMMPMPCMQCDHPPCTKVCPVYATYSNPEGIVPQIYWQCIGCRYCVNACPYTCKYFNWEDPVFPEPLDRGLNPDVSVRTRGVTEKCNFCLHRLQHVRDRAAFERRPLRAGEFNTACQQICPTKAIAFGDLEDPESDVSNAHRDTRAEMLLEDLGTEPKVIYLRESR